MLGVSLVSLETTEGELLFGWRILACLKTMGSMLFR